LKGPPYGAPLRVGFANKENIESATENLRKIKEPVPPKKGSQWILFIPFSLPNNGKFETFEGTKGCIAYSEAALTEIIDDLNKRGQLYKSGI
jgi:hypothetical protein